MSYLFELAVLRAELSALQINHDALKIKYRNLKSSYLEMSREMVHLVKLLNVEEERRKNVEALCASLSQEWYSQTLGEVRSARAEEA